MKKNQFIIEWDSGTVLPSEVNKQATAFVDLLKANNANIATATITLDGKTTNVLSGAHVEA